MHGILHLLGYDHAEPEEHEEMFGLQDELLAEWRAVPEHDLVAIVWLLWPRPPSWSCSPGCSPAPTRRSSTFSRARAEELVAEGRPGAKRLTVLLDDRARYLNTALLLRLLCEIAAIVLVDPAGPATPATAPRSGRPRSPRSA